MLEPKATYEFGNQLRVIPRLDHDHVSGLIVDNIWELQDDVPSVLEVIVRCQPAVDLHSRDHDLVIDGPIRFRQLSQARSQG